MVDGQHSTDGLLPAIEQRLAARKTPVRNKATLGALVKLIPVVGDALHHALTSGDEAERDERIHLLVEAILELVVGIDNALTRLVDRFEAIGAQVTEVGGLIRLRTEGGETAIGLHVAPESGPVRFNPGSVIDVATRGTRSTTGLLIGKAPAEGARE